MFFNECVNTVWNAIDRQTDGQTDRQTDSQTDIYELLIYVQNPIE